MPPDKVPRKPLPPHWYMRYIEECPICFHHVEWLGRRYTPKPPDPEDRVAADFNAYDHCQDDPYT
jgi:hypothetical protein